MITVKQKQCLLEYLGYYSTENSNKQNNVDAIWGPDSIKATEKFQNDYGLAPDGIFGPATEAKILEVIHTGKRPGVDWGKVKYFTKEEFKCKCGGKYCNGYPAEPSKKLVDICEKTRKHFGRAMIVNSGLRCQEYNDSLDGSVPNSRHIQGKAVDFKIRIKGDEYMDSDEIVKFVKTLPEVRYAYAINSRSVHMDVE